jgi:hypothetical protein
MGNLVGLCQYNQLLEDVCTILEGFVDNHLVDSNLFHLAGICAAP